MAGFVIACLALNLGLEWYYLRTSNQMAILSDHVGAFSCPQAAVVEGTLTGPSLLSSGDSMDDLRIAMPKSCIDRLQRLVTANRAFRLQDCSFADVCWTDYGRTSHRSFVELHFLNGEIIFRRIRA